MRIIKDILEQEDRGDEDSRCSSRVRSSERKVHGIISSTLFHTRESFSEMKGRRFYQSCMDRSGKLEEIGAKPIHDIIEEVGGWSLTGKSRKK